MAVVTHIVHNFRDVPCMYSSIFPAARQDAALESEFEVLHSPAMRITLRYQPAGGIFPNVNSPSSPSADEHSIVRCVSRGGERSSRITTACYWRTTNSRQVIRYNRSAFILVSRGCQHARPIVQARYRRTRRFATSRLQKPRFFVGGIPLMKRTGRVDDAHDRIFLEIAIYLMLSRIDPPVIGKDEVLSNGKFKAESLGKQIRVWNVGISKC